MQVRLTENPVGFKQGQVQQNILMQQMALVNADNDNLHELAVRQTYSEGGKRHTGISKYFLALPLVDSIVRGFMPVAEKVTNETEKVLIKTKKATLCGKMLKTGKCALGWTGILAVGGLYYALKDGVNSHIKSFKHFDENHPLMSLIADVGVLCGALFFGGKGLNKLCKKYPKIFKNAENHVTKMASNLDKTILNKKVYPAVTKGLHSLSGKAPKVAEVIKGLLPYSWVFMMGAGIVDTMNKSAKADKKLIEKNYNKLKEQQVVAAKNVINMLGAETMKLSINTAQLKNKLMNSEMKNLTLENQIIRSELASKTNA